MSLIEIRSLTKVYQKRLRVQRLDERARKLAASKNISLGQALEIVSREKEWSSMTPAERVAEARAVAERDNISTADALRQLAGRI